MKPRRDPAGESRPSAPLLPLGAMMLAGFSAMPAAQAQQAEAEKARELPAVSVQAESDKPDGYRATATRVGKVLQDPHDIPQAVTTVTGTLMEEQQVGSLKEALRNVSGLSFNAAEGGRSGDNMNLRGFYTFGDMYLDGIRDTAQYNRETFNHEQIDVLRGAGAMLFGRGQAGGVINQVSKTPLRTEQYKLTGSVGTDGYQEVTADINKPINPNTALRVNVMHRDEGSWRSNPATGTEPELHREGIGISLGLNLYTHNQWWLNHYWLKTNDIPDYGISFDGATRAPATTFADGTPLPPTTFWGSDRTFDKSDTRMTTLVNEYRFSADSTLRSQLRIADYERSYWARTPSLAVQPNANAAVCTTPTTCNGGPTRVADYETITLQSDYSTRFHALGMKHEALAGVEYLKEKSFRHSLLNVGGTTAANPPLFLPYVVNTAGNPVRFDSDSYAVYVQDTIEFVPKWKATLGLRRDQMDATYSSATSPALEYGENSYRSALSFHPAEDTHYYLGWSDSFSPTADLYQLSGNELPAERSAVTELGGKWLLADGDLSLRAALYQATKHWERNTDLETTAALLSRKRTTKGVEFEVAGRITENWEIFAGIALMDARVIDQNDGTPIGTFAAITANGTATGPTGVAGTGYLNATEAGDAGETVFINRSPQTSESQRPRNTPKYTFNLWTTYRVAPRWRIGGGVEAKGDRLGYGIGTCGTATQNTQIGANLGKWSYNNCSTSAFNPNRAPSYVRWDAMVAYEHKDWTLRLNVKNVFDKLYYDSVYDNGGFAVPGTRRAVILTGEFKF